MKQTHLLLTLFLSPVLACASEAQEWDAKFQSTYIWQQKEPFSASYSGSNSLTTSKEDSFSFTTTAFLGYRPWENGEIYFNPEIAAGHPLSNLTGLGGFTNGEMQKSTGTTPKLYMARLFLRQTWGLGGDRELVESGQNRLAGVTDKNRVVLTVGNLAVNDIFDTNAYSNDPRTQFLNWSFLVNGAFDFASNARGYTWGAALEDYYGNWVWRIGRFMLPKQPNQLPLDQHIFQHYGDQVEIEHHHVVDGKQGTIKLLAFHDRAVLARFSDALANADGGVPDITLVRNTEQNKYGVGINLEQTLADNIGGFARAMHSDGKTETDAFTEIDQSFSFGLEFKGALWARPDDTFGLAFAENQLSRDRRNYLAAGGMSFFLGDGALNYKPEQIVEGYYKWGIGQYYWISLDAQGIANPAYNADRGPAYFAGIRLHGEY